MQTQPMNIRKPSYSAAPVWGAKYSAAEAPEGQNIYLKSILCPFDVRDAALPLPPFTPAMPRPIEINITKNWVIDGAILLLVFTPASPYRILKLFLYTSGSWKFLQNLNPDDPLNLNFRQYRTVSAGLQLRSAAQAAGVFTVAGVINSARINSMPPFNNPPLTFNNFVAFATDPRSTVKQVPIEEGLVVLWKPTGTNQYRIPETDFVTNLENILSATYNASDTAWLFGPTPIPLLANASVTIFSTGNSGQGFPDPMWGKYRINFLIKITSTTVTDVTLSVQKFENTADPTTWVDTSSVTVIKQMDYSIGAGYTVTYSLSTEVLVTDGLLQGFDILLGVTNPSAVTILNDKSFTFESLDFYKDTFLQPADMVMISSVNVGQPVSLAACLNYQVVPDYNISKYVTTMNTQESEILSDMAVAVLNDSMSGPRMHLPYKTYMGLIIEGYFDRICSGNHAYQAAMPGLKAKLMSFWRSLPDNQRDAIIELGKGAGRLGLDVIGGSVPQLAPLAMVGRSYLAAPDGSGQLAIRSKPMSEARAPADYYAADPEVNWKASKKSDYLEFDTMRQYQAFRAARPCLLAEDEDPKFFLPPGFKKGKWVFTTFYKIRDEKYHAKTKCIRHDVKRCLKVGCMNAQYRIPDLWVFYGEPEVKVVSEPKVLEVADYQAADWEEFERPRKTQDQLLFPKSRAKTSKASGELTAPKWVNNGAVSRAVNRTGLFPVVPGPNAQHLEPQILKLTWSTSQPNSIETDGGPRTPEWYQFPDGYSNTQQSAAILYVEVGLPFEGNFLERLYLFAVNQKLIASGANFLYLPRAVSLEGGSWHLAAVMALIGLGKQVAFSGDINLETMELLPVGKTADKLQFCSSVNLPLIVRPVDLEAYKNDYRSYGMMRTSLLTAADIVSGKLITNPGGAAVMSVSDAILSVGQLRGTSTQQEYTSFKTFEEWVNVQDPNRAKKYTEDVELGHSTFAQTQDALTVKREIASMVREARQAIEEMKRLDPKLNNNEQLAAMQRRLDGMEFDVLPRTNNLTALKQLKEGEGTGGAKRLHSAVMKMMDQVSAKANKTPSSSGPGSMRPPGQGKSKSSRNKANLRRRYEEDLARARGASMGPPPGVPPPRQSEPRAPAGGASVIPDEAFSDIGF